MASGQGPIEGFRPFVKNMKSSTKFAILASIYFSQGLPYGFFREALPVVLRHMGTSLPKISLLSLLALPWALKFLWAPWVDRIGLPRFGIRKTWLLVMQVLNLILFVSLSMMDGGGAYTYLAVGFFLANLLAATQDIAADGLAVSMLDPGERGFGNGLQVAGYRLGMIAGGGFLLMWFPFLAWRGSFWAIGLGILVATLPIFYYREPPPQPDAELRPFVLLTRLLTRKGFLLWLGVIGFYKFGDELASTMLKPFLVDLGLSMVEIGRMVGIAGSVGGLTGALAGGVLVTYLGRFRAVFLFGLLQAAAVYSYYLLATGLLDERYLFALCFAEHFLGSMATAAAFTVMMDLCESDSPSTDYTVQASMVVVAKIAAGTVSGFVAEAWGYLGNFALSAGLSLAGAVLFALVYRRWSGQPAAVSL